MGKHCHGGGGLAGGDDDFDMKTVGLIIGIAVGVVWVTWITVAAITTDETAGNTVLACAVDDDCAAGYSCSGDMCRPKTVSTIRVGPTGLGFGVAW